MEIEKFKNLRYSYSLAKHIGIELSNVKKYSQYIDSSAYFFDHILELNDCYINFCMMTEINQGRYLILKELNEKIDDKLFMKSESTIFEFENNKWFYEKIQKYHPIKITSFEIPKLFQNLKELSNQASKLKLDQVNILLYNNLFNKMSSYKLQIKNMFDEETFKNHVKKFNEEFYITYADLEKSFELNRIIFDGDNFKFAGLQSFLPCPLIYSNIISVIYSSLNDQEEELLKKLRLLNIKSPMIKIIESIKKQIMTSPDYYQIDTSILLLHLNRIIKKWQELQFIEKAFEIN